MPANVEAMVRGCVPSDVALEFTLNRTHCTLAGKAHATLKDLNVIWSNESLNPHRLWHEGNTVLIDDSPSKASLTPFNVLPVPTFQLVPVTHAKDVGSGSSDNVLETLCDMLLEWSDGLSAQQWCKRHYSRCPRHSSLHLQLLSTVGRALTSRCCRFPISEGVEECDAKPAKAAVKSSGEDGCAGVKDITRSMKSTSLIGKTPR
jgi:hypothetical protein